jgi:AmiR/NasT family two-component response regulator
LRPRSSRDPCEFVGSAADRLLITRRNSSALNIYSHTASAFDPFDAELMRLYTVAAGQAISNAGRWQNSRETVTQLEKALLSRSDIDMAKGALIALHGCEPDEAFARLVDESQRRNVKVRDVALELLDRMKTTS